jgi:ArsR family transcriptional regulator, arsenate/arsenite/antimonite-responsive transcriptional repressor
MRAAQRERDLGDRELIRALKALADPTRFRMVQEIAEAGELSCGAVAEKFDVSQPTISHHMKILLDAGILLQRTEGKHHFISVDRELLAALATLLPTRLSETGIKKRRT